MIQGAYNKNKIGHTAGLGTCGTPKGFAARERQGWKERKSCHQSLSKNEGNANHQDVIHTKNIIQNKAQLEIPFKYPFLKHDVKDSSSFCNSPSEIMNQKWSKKKL